MAVTPGGAGPSGTAPRIFPVVDEGLGNSSYLVDLGGGEALVVDPARDPSPYLALAAAHGLRIVAAAETHLHADFLSGSRELAAAGRARVIAPRDSRLAFPHQGVEDGEAVEAGNGLELRALATPGHAPEHVAWLLADRTATGEDGLVLFTGGALMVGSVARTDLVSPEETEPLARAAYRSVRRLLTLPDGLPVYPTHGAGSFCAAPTSGERTTTIGAERLGNPLALAEDEDAFVRRLREGLGAYPPYFLRLRAVNRRGPGLLEPGWETLAKLPPERVAEIVSQGGALVDARPVAAFAAGHPAGAISIALRPQFATWLGWLLEDDRPLVVLLDDGQDRAELARQARTIGYDRLLGEVGGGLAGWEAAGLPTERIPLVTPEELAKEPAKEVAKEPAGDPAGTVVDVRHASETAAGHLPGALTIPLGDLPGSLRAGVQGLASGPVTVMCAHGERAMTGASLIARSQGADGLRVLRGGAADWARAAGRDLARDLARE